MVERMTSSWHPRPEHFSFSGVSELMRATGGVTYDELLALSLREPQLYWDAVLKHCRIEWQRSPDSYIDLSHGREFPRWFAGGQLNWVNTILAWGARPETAHQDAVVTEREDGTVEALSYAQLDLAVKAFAAGLKSQGIARGDRIGLLMENGVHATVSMLAIVALGGVVVPLFSGFGVDAIVARLTACNARAVIASTGFTRRAKPMAIEPALREAWKALPDLEFVIWRRAEGGPSQETASDRDWEKVSELGRKQRFALEIMSPDDPFMVIYTSGTTGKPKGAVHTHGGFPIKIAHDAVVHFDVKPGDRFCWPADMGWIAGSLVLGCALLRGATLICYDGAPDFPDWSRMSRLVERHRITHFGSAPTLIRGLANHEIVATQGDVSSVRLLITAGEGIDAEHFNWFQRHFGRGVEPLINYTGGTEVSGALLSSVVVRPISPAGFNTVSPGVDVDVVDPSGNSAVDAIGELAIRGPFLGMTQSFWRDDERYLDSYWRTIPGLWVHGDLALHTATGDFFMMGRSDDTIKMAGKRLGPAEVEQIVMELAEVAEAAAIGVQDADKGQKLVVFVVPALGCSASAKEISAAIDAQVDRRLGRPFRPSAVHVVTQLPKTRSSKIMRRVIRSVFCGVPAGDLSALENPSALEELRALAALA